MRPWMDRNQDQLWVSYDRNNTIELVSIQLFEDAFVLEGEVPAQEPAAEPETDTAPKEGGCSGMLLLPLMLTVRRKAVFRKRSS